GAHRDSANPDLPAALDGAATVVKLLGAGLRLADDPLRRRRPQLVATPAAPGLGQSGLLALEPVDRILLPLASLRRAAGICIAGADPELLDRSVDRPRRSVVDDLPAGDPADRISRHRSRLDLRLLL